ncbi:MAG: cache domain-containing protein [Candidatus Cloacimonetes bacterium]|nr:cache domain-containing protein [Candidatus Cloacimonadota bacterium]MCF7814270.1 cache domain-containing protein [Candidatus Cloacimonadota bacterium]MCF7868931.1 cache domain-containing protein [Candidatus Cloacimonadota bacterium]MCF7884312.1 cache domain-containing protein [Candidatus Cloacimonadota bacterium]
MKKFTLVLFVFIVLLSCTPKEQKREMQDQVPDLSIYDHQVTKDVVQLVYDAVDLINQDGEEAFPRFREENSKWYKGDDYVFVWGLDGMRYVYPRDVSGEGKNMIDLEDINGKPIGKMFVETAQNGEGWVFYEWTLPGGEKQEWKSTFIKKAVTPAGNEYLVGFGKYKMPMEKIFVSNIVIEAVNLLKHEGKEIAFARFNDKADKFIFLNTYVFVKTMAGVELVNPNSTHLVGKDITDLQDANGKYFVKEELEMLQDRESLWMDYMWPKPGEKEPSKKMVFVKKAETEAETLVVGAGFYLD